MSQVIMERGSKCSKLEEGVSGNMRKSSQHHDYLPLKKSPGFLRSTGSVIATFSAMDVSITTDR